MIEVYTDKQGEKYRLLVKGHAGQEEQGHLVCAAVSALTVGLVEYAKKSPTCRYLRTAADKGMVFLSCLYGLENAFEMTVLALGKLAAAYPQHITCYEGVTDALICEKKR